MTQGSGFEELWQGWLAAAAGDPDALEHRLVVDLAPRLPRPLAALELAALAAFVREFARAGAGWIARGLRGDEVAASFEFLATLDPALLDALHGKVRDAEFHCWLGGSLDRTAIDRSRSYTRFVIASASRSGTHLLRTLLCSHPCVEMHGESFNTLGLALLPYGLETDVDTVLARHVFRPCFDYVEAVGFVLFRNLSATWAGENVWDELAAMEDLRVIVLERANHLARFASLKRSLSDKVWYVGVTDSEVSAAERVEITPRELEADIALHEGSRARFLAQFHRQRVLCLTYEQLVEDTDAVAARVIEFLGVHSCRLVSGTKKKETRRLGEVVANLDELRQHFAGGPHAWMFTDA
ncbi:MAG: sulfotransferase domain-containing protein [Planctomycetes bacterium]|nr:sulfotransferase domain-containing protein [Planctomycetota bacterium]MCB9868731.1 sulfotransferase domain-containing protein [Planctomycetota bacterium]